MQNQITTLPSGVRVELVLERAVQFAGYAPTDLWCVRALERCASDDFEIDGVVQEVWNAFQTEYYRDVPDQRVMAAYAYTERCKTPFKQSRYAMSLDALGMEKSDVRN